MMYKRFIFFRPKVVYVLKLLTPAPTTSDPLACYETDVICYTNKRKAQSYLRAANRGAKATGSDNTYILREVRVL